MKNGIYIEVYMKLDGESPLVRSILKNATESYILANVSHDGKRWVDSTQTLFEYLETEFHITVVDTATGNEMHLTDDPEKQLHIILTYGQ
jgi:hypothetical protein